jgi:hypothetical protein
MFTELAFRLYNTEPTKKCAGCHEGGPNVCLSNENGITCKGLAKEAPKC